MATTLTVPTCVNTRKPRPLPPLVACLPIAFHPWDCGELLAEHPICPSHNPAPGRPRTPQVRRLHGPSPARKVTHAPLRLNARGCAHRRHAPEHGRLWPRAPRRHLRTCTHFTRRAHVADVLDTRTHHRLRLASPPHHIGACHGLAAVTPPCHPKAPKTTPFLFFSLACLVVEEPSLPVTHDCGLVPTHKQQHHIPQCTALASSLSTQAMAFHP
jgi:hypothetical protein